MRLSIKEIKYVRQSLQYRAEYYKDIKSFNEKINKQIEVNI